MNAEELDDFVLLSRACAGVREAQAIFYGRHYDYLRAELERRAGFLQRTAGLGVEDVVQEAFQRAFRYGATMGAQSEVDREVARRRVRAWLGRIVQNHVTNALGKATEVPSSPQLETLAAEEHEPAPPSRPEVRTMRRALATLSEREQDVLRVTLMHQSDAGSSRLPHDIADELASRWNISQDNLRAIRMRALKKIKAQYALLLQGEDGPDGPE